MVAPSQDSAFSSELCGLAADVARFLASLFPVSRNLALPVSILNLPRVQEKKKKKKNPSWDLQPVCLTSVIQSSLFTTLRCASSRKLFFFPPRLIPKTHSAHFGLLVCCLSGSFLAIVSGRTQAAGCVNSSQNKSGRGQLAERQPPPPPFRKGLTDNSDTFQAARLPAAILLFITGTAQPLIPPTVLSAAAHTLGLVNECRVLP